MTDDYAGFKSEILKLTDIDLNLYQEKQMKRRIDVLIGRLGLTGYAAYVGLLSADREKLTSFLDYITINVTEFFRTPAQWQDMEETALKQLCGEKRCIRAWSVACASGEEPYSLAISLQEKYPQNDIEILATDIDDKILEKSVAGLYSAQQMESVPENIRNKYFTRHGNLFEVNDAIRSRISFRKMNLLKFEFPTGFDLIMARNVLIYFTKEAKNIIFLEFNRSLNDGGYLFTGSTEQMIYYKQMNYERIKPYLYQKISNGGTATE